METLGVQYVEFFISSLEQRDENGNPKYVEKEFVRITNPGGKDVAEREVQEKDKIAYMAQYKAFKDGVTYEGEGFKLRDCAFLTKSEIEMCVRAKIYTVEALAGVEENGMKALGLDAHTLRTKAENWIKSRSSADALVNQINALEKRLDAQSDLVNELQMTKGLLSEKDVQIKELNEKIQSLMEMEKNVESKGKK